MVSSVVCSNTWRLQVNVSWLMFTLFWHSEIEAQIDQSTQRILIICRLMVYSRIITGSGRAESSLWKLPDWYQTGTWALTGLIPVTLCCLNTEHHWVDTLKRNSSNQSNHSLIYCSVSKMLLLLLWSSSQHVLMSNNTLSLLSQETGKSSEYSDLGTGEFLLPKWLKHLINQTLLVRT